MAWQAAITDLAHWAGQAAFDRIRQGWPQVAQLCAGNAAALGQLAGVLHAAGFLHPAAECYLQQRSLQPADPAPVANLAAIARDQGNHAECRRLYQALLQALPGSLPIRRNALLSLEYDPDVSATERLAAAMAWGEAASRLAGDLPVSTDGRQAGRPLRVGYLGADFCQHTVGWLFEPVLAAHDAQRVSVFVYNASRHEDVLTRRMRRFGQWREVGSLCDADIARQIRADNIDVLVDLSGHTAGSRLSVLAWRPAPLQLSWLGYFATTGLAAVDAVLLDEWHAPPSVDAHFCERVIRLPAGRWCFKPPEFAPEVQAGPYGRNGFITFGSFNNSGKLNKAVLDCWAGILRAVPDARLLLKWRTFNDDHFCQAMKAAFAERGVNPQRLILRGPSFHVDMLAEYADVDIALDTFPFSGGMTSCEALWMGVPVLTWPQDRVVSRQTLSMLSAIGLSEWAASDAQVYHDLAVGLAGKAASLAALRFSLRQRMARSCLLDVKTFTQGLEAVLEHEFAALVAGRQVL